MNAICLTCKPEPSGTQLVCQNASARDFRDVKLTHQFRAVLQGNSVFSSSCNPNVLIALLFCRRLQYDCHNNNNNVLIMSYFSELEHSFFQNKPVTTNFREYTHTHTKKTHSSDMHTHQHPQTHDPDLVYFDLEGSNLQNQMLLLQWPQQPWAGEQWGHLLVQALSVISTTVRI